MRGSSLAIILYRTAFIFSMQIAILRKQIHQSRSQLYSCLCHQKFRRRMNKHERDLALVGEDTSLSQTHYIDVNNC
jgi:hypothetical protein